MGSWGILIMTTLLLKRSNTAGNDAYTGLLGQITLDTQARKLRIHDGIKAGGYIVANMDDVQAIVDTVSGLSITDVVGLESALSTLTTNKADKTTTITAGNGVTGGGDLSTNRTITLGTPSTLTGSTTNAVTATSHTHAITVTKADVGLSNVDNTSDASKPVSTAQQAAIDLKIDNSEKGAVNGVATLDGSGKVPAIQLPSFVDDVLEFSSLGSFPATGETGKIYIALDSNKTYRWSGSAYVFITSGAVDSVAGKTGIVTLTKSDVGLVNVDNTSDASKPVSTATQDALNLKANLASPAFTGNPTAPTQAAGNNSTRIATTAFVQTATGALNTGVSSVSGTAPITVGGTAVNPTIAISAATTSAAGSMSSTDKTKLNGIESGAQVNTVTSVAGKTGAVTLAKADVGLANVQNYGIATTAEAQAATSDIKYMTPLKTAQLIDEYVIDCGTF